MASGLPAASEMIRFHFTKTLIAVRKIIRCLSLGWGLVELVVPTPIKQIVQLIEISLIFAMLFFSIPPKLPLHSLSTI